MKLEKLQKMIHDVTSVGKTPMTMVLTPEDAKDLGLPSWTRQFLGMKVVIAHNFTESKVVPDVYEAVTLKRRNTNGDSNPT